MDHMLTLFAKHGLFNCTITCVGDTDVDFHHSAEDIGICLGQALKQALGDQHRALRHKLRAHGRVAGARVHRTERQQNLVYNVELSVSHVNDFECDLAHDFLRQLPITRLTFTSACPRRNVKYSSLRRSRGFAGRWPRRATTIPSPGATFHRPKQCRMKGETRCLGGPASWFFLRCACRIAVELPPVQKAPLPEAYEMLRKCSIARPSRFFPHASPIHGAYNPVRRYRRGDGKNASRHRP